MAHNSGIHHRRSIRLQGYDYSQRGAYFVTLCTHNDEHLFGSFVGANNHSPSLSHNDLLELSLNDAGLAANRCWLEIPDHFPSVELDAFITMPNHVHGILLLGDSDDSPSRANRANDYSHLQDGAGKEIGSFNRVDGTSKTIGSVVRGFKIGVTKWFRKNRLEIDTVWQRNYYEHVIRKDDELNDIRLYIANNPARVNER